MAESNRKEAVFVEPGAPFLVRPSAGHDVVPGEVLVRVAMCTLCGSDLHTFEGRRSTPCPTVLGHEIVGEVIALGEATLDYSGVALDIGDRVTWTIAASCGQCFYCEHGIPQKCVTLFKYGHESCDEHPLSGGLGDVCLLRAGTAIFKIPDRLSDEVVCPANCATATVTAALRAAGSVDGQAVLVQGAGMLGVTAAAMARHRGARMVIVTDVETMRLETARSFGATDVVDVSTSPDALRDIVRSTTDGRGVDVALELSGSNEAAANAIEALRISGKLVLVGSVFPAAPLPVSLEDVVRRQLRIEGVHNYAPEDLGDALDFLAATHERYPFASLVPRRFPLDDVDEAFRIALKDRLFRVAVTPGPFRSG